MSSAYLEHPKNFRFQGQDKDEEIILVLRAHPVTNLNWIIPAVMIFFIPLIIPKLIPYLGFDFSFLSNELLISMNIINYIIVLVIVFEGFLGWYFNVYILTHKRIYDFDFNSLLNRNVDLAPLNQIQEANGSTLGLLGAIFHYGHVLVQTAGANVAIDFHNIPQPEKVADLIMDEVEKHGGKKHAG